MGSSSKMAVERRVFEEVAVGGFAHVDPEVGYFSIVSSLVRPHHRLLDFGAGRGEFYFDDPSEYRRWIQNFRGRCAHVDGCDVDPVVLENPTLDSAAVIEPGKPLPYEDGSFDIVISRYVFEHVTDPDWTARELLRIVKPGGWVCALTVNKWGYIALGARLIPNSLHAKALRRIQPHREAIDVFPTVYRLNTARAVRHHFAGAEVYHYMIAGVPSYHFGNAAILRALLILQRLMPAMLYPGLGLFIRKGNQ